MSASGVAQQPQPQPQSQSLPTTEAAAASAISSAFPAPPPFYKSFTPANIALLAARDSSSLTAEDPFSSTVEREGEEAEAGEAAAVVVGELAHLIPPLPPQDGKYRSFGVLHDVYLSSSPLSPPLAAACKISNPLRSSPINRKAQPQENPRLLSTCSPSRSQFS